MSEAELGGNPEENKFAHSEAHLLGCFLSLKGISVDIDKMNYLLYATIS